MNYYCTKENCPFDGSTWANLNEKEAKEYVCSDCEKMDDAREDWAKIAKANGWYTEPFFVQGFFNKNNEMMDSVSFRGMTADIVVETDAYDR